jgi:hypothetical protein
MGGAMMTKRTQGKRCLGAQGGQAMVEFLVSALFFLVPLFLAIAALGKFIDVQHTTNMAARYAAWERTVWYEQDSSKFYTINAPNQKSSSAIGNEIVARLLNDRSNTGDIIKDTDKTASTLVNGTDPMWRDTAGTAYLDDYQQVTSTASSATPSQDVAGAALTDLAKVKVKGLLNFVPPLPTDTMAVAKVSLGSIAKKSEVYQRLWADAPAWSGLDFEATGAVLSNTWSSNSRTGTTAMVKEEVPTAQGLGAFITGVQASMAPWDPLGVSGMEVGKIAVDQVPADRLK